MGATPQYMSHIEPLSTRESMLWIFLLGFKYISSIKSIECVTIVWRCVTNVWRYFFLYSYEKKGSIFGMRASRPFSLLSFVFYYYLYKISPLNWMLCFLRFQDVILGRDSCTIYYYENSFKRNLNPFFSYFKFYTFEFICVVGGHHISYTEALLVS